MTKLKSQFINQAGQPLTGEVTIELDRVVIDAKTGQKVIPFPQTVALDPQGAFETDLWPNARGEEESLYRLTLGRLSLSFSLPDQPEVELAEVAEL